MTELLHPRLSGGSPRQFHRDFARQLVAEGQLSRLQRLDLRNNQSDHTSGHGLNHPGFPGDSIT